jgi:outer membrane protein assembly factor BamB
MSKTKSREAVIVASFAVLLLIGQSAIPAADDSTKAPNTWPQWRGPTRDGFVPSDAKWPASLKKDVLRQTWRVELGPSYSGPIVAEDRVFVTETAKAKEEVVRALDRKTGKELWQVRWEGAMRVPFFAMANGSWIRATPAYDGESLFVAGMRDVLVCLNAKTGKENWRIDFVERLKTPLPSFGFVSSPLVIGEFVYVQAGGALRKINKRNGELIWDALADGGGMYGSAFSSPYLATVAGKSQLLVQTRTKLAGVDADSGDVLWSREIAAFRGMNILTPTVVNDAVFTTSYGGRAQLLKVAADDGAYKVTPQWDDNTQGYMSTPVIIDGHAYLHLKNQRFTCINIATGERKWTTTPFGKYWSLVANGKIILALDERGELLLINATPEKFDLIDRREISDDSTWAHLAVTGDEVFVRELKAIAAYEWGADAE